MLGCLLQCIWLGSYTLLEHKCQRLLRDKIRKFRAHLPQARGQYSITTCKPQLSMF